MLGLYFLDGSDTIEESPKTRPKTFKKNQDFVRKKIEMKIVATCKFAGKSYTQIIFNFIQIFTISGKTTLILQHW